MRILAIMSLNLYSKKMPTLPNITNSTNTLIPTQNQVLPIEGMLFLFTIAIILILVILCCAVHNKTCCAVHNKKCKKDQRTRYPDLEQEFFYLDAESRIPVSIRCEQYRDIRAGRIPRVIEESNEMIQEPIIHPYTSR
ncbi:hypothetical protein [Ehrlichia japonica]|uniref:Uncharacterized protein n=1 Tax=Ehrlichia japonica TaxID=391036 RepID=X5GKS3_9RICK|nr:hypothetical protein [Ehrlichia japonica]AHX05003.1 hypothetical protein EHF_0216 [Ehrlichia japonica]